MDASQIENINDELHTTYRHFFSGFKQKLVLTTELFRLRDRCKRAQSNNRLALAESLKMTIQTMRQVDSMIFDYCCHCLEKMHQMLRDLRDAGVDFPVDLLQEAVSNEDWRDAHLDMVNAAQRNTDIYGD